MAAQPSTAYTFENGLTLTGSIATFGGALNQDTVLDGDNDTYSLAFRDLSVFTAIATEINLVAGTALNIVTPNVSNSSASAGSLLQLINATSGESEFTPYSFPLTSGAQYDLLRLDGADTLQWVSFSSLVNNGLNVDAGVIQLGGDLVEDTVVSGDANTFSLSFYFLNEFNINSVITTLASDELVVSIPSTASTEVGWVLAESVASGGNAVWHANNVFPIETLLVNTQLDDTNGTLIVEPAAGNINISLPDATLNHGLTYTIKQVGTGTVAIASSAQDIYDTAQVPSKTLSVSGETVRIQAHATADGGNGLWYII
jgi:hypothetical protein